MGIDFQEENNLQRSNVPAQQPQGGIVGMLIKSGIVKNKAQAGYVLLGVAILCIVLAAYFLMSGPSVPAA
ncbi:MAG: hypothetical protein WDZ93_02435 [Candidatus Paceibacterota bacterium]